MLKQSPSDSLVQGSRQDGVIAPHTRRRQPPSAQPVVEGIEITPGDLPQFLLAELIRDR
jgi:hypothetical protein